MATGEKIIGIDLGTTNSVVAVMEGKEAKVIANAEGNRLTPSVVAFTDKGEMLVGEPAKRQAVTNPTRTVYSIKRFMGRRHSEVESEEKMVPYEVVGGAEDYVKVKVGDKEYTPHEISAKILRKLKEAAESYLGHKVNKAVITVPAYFNDAQRQATKDAGQIAGLEVARIINEPTAAAAGLRPRQEEGREDRRVRPRRRHVRRFGPGSAARRASFRSHQHQRRYAPRRRRLRRGADQLRRRRVQEGKRLDLRKDTMALQRLQEACEKAKKELSSLPARPISICRSSRPMPTAPKHLQMTITPQQVRELVDHLIERCRKPGLAGAEGRQARSPSEIDEVVLVGGARASRRCSELVKEMFKQRAAQGRESGRSRRRWRRHSGRRARRRVQGRAAARRDAAVARHRDPGRRDHEARREATRRFRPSGSRSSARRPTIRRRVTVQVFQGERKMAADNRLLGQFDLEGIPPAPRGMPQIEVKFDIDANGILNVSAKDLGTGKEPTSDSSSRRGLSKDEIEKMRRDAEAHAEEDKKKFELAEPRNQADNMTLSSLRR